MNMSVTSSKQLLYLISLFSVIAWSESNFVSFTDIKHLFSGNVQIVHCNRCQYVLVGLLLLIIIYLYFYLYLSLSLSLRLSDLTCVNDACLRAGKVCGSILGLTSAETTWGASREMWGDSAFGRLSVMTVSWEAAAGRAATRNTSKFPTLRRTRALRFCKRTLEGFFFPRSEIGFRESEMAFLTGLHAAELKLLRGLRSVDLWSHGPHGSSVWSPSNARSLILLNAHRAGAFYSHGKPHHG